MKKLRPIHLAIIMGIFAAFFVYEAFSSEHLSYHFSFVGYGGTFKNHDLKIVGIPIYWFLLLCGFIITLIVSWNRCEKYHINKIGAIVFPVLFLLIAYAGGKILYIVENYIQFKKSGLELDGMSLYGAIYLVLIAVPLIAICTKKRVLSMYDFFTPFGIILLACVRTGCFFNGCCGAITIWNETTPIILPVQLIEVVSDLLILELCFWIEKKYTFKGYMYPAFMLLYGVCRFLLEFLRDTPKDIAFLSHGQVFSLIGIVLSLIMFAICKQQKSKHI